MRTYNNLEREINRNLELSSICRGEWCRALESEMDVLENELHEVIKAGEMEDLKIALISNKIRKAYGNFSPDIHV
jgi:hypothetical protein